MNKGKICNYNKGKLLFSLGFFLIFAFFIAPNALAESIMLDQQVSIMSAQDIAISKVLLIISSFSSYLIGLFIVLLIVSIMLLFIRANAYVRTMDKAYALPQILFKKPINSFEKLGPKDEKGTYLRSYSDHKKYHQVAKGSFWATLGTTALKVVLIYTISHVAISGIISMAQEDFFDAGKQIQCGDILTYQITYENVGTGAATGAKITASIPHGTEYIQGSAFLNNSPIEPAITDNIIEFNIGTVLPGESGYVIYSVGLPECAQETSSDYDLGYQDGYARGYDDGINERQYNNPYEGYETGYEGGYNSGYSVGYEEGSSYSQPTGGSEYEEGCIFGYSTGYENGYLQAPYNQNACGTDQTDYVQGCFYGYETGYYDGLDGLEYNLDACYGGTQTIAMFKMAQISEPVSNQATFTFNEGGSVTSNIVENPVATGAPAPSGGEVCGNGIIEGAEECDDGNTTSGDGCSATCALEPIKEDVMPEGIYEPLCCLGGGTGCEAENAFTDQDADCATGNPLYGTHSHTFNIPFIDMPVGSINLACNVIRSDGSTLNLIDGPITNNAITTLYLSHTLTAASPVNNNVPWEIQGCIYTVNAGAAVNLPGAAGHKIYVHTTSWTGVKSADDDAKRALDCYSQGLNRYFANTAACSFSGDVAFAMTMASGTNLEGYCHDSRDNDGNTLIDCPDNSCHGVAYPTCASYRVASSMIASSICPGNICTGTINFSNKTVTYSYTQHVKPSGKFKVKFVNGAVTSGTGLISNYISFIPQFISYGKYEATGLSTLPTDVLFPNTTTPTSYQTYADSIEGTVNHVMWVQFQNVTTSDQFELLLTYDGQIRRASGLYLYPHGTAPSNDDESEVVADLNMNSPCADNVDNDLDFGTDCADIQCDKKVGNTATGAKCEYGTELTCDDGFDNDRDGFADCLDSDCDGKQGGKVKGNTVYCQYGNESGSANCGDEFDNDADGQPDCLDQTSCWHNDSYGCPSTEISCSDNIDNDHDQNYSNNYDTDPATGKDCADYDCAGNPACPATENERGNDRCFDSKDNDLDHAIDCYDSDCAGVEVGENACYEQEFILGQANRCANSKEDDFDAPTAKKDCADNQKDRANAAIPGSDCWAVFEMCGPCPFNEFINYGACADGIDNDYDDGAGGYSPAAGGSDCGDSDCLGQIGNFQGDVCQSNESNCSDNFDNDKDGAVDCADAGCFGKIGSQGEICEPGGESSCSDGYDNDRDGLSDCADPNCHGTATCFPESWSKVSCTAVPSVTSLTSIVVGGTIQYQHKTRLHSNDNYTIRFVGTATDYSTIRIVVGQGGAIIPFNATACALSGPSAGTLVYSSSQPSSGKIDAVTTPVNTFDATLTCPLTGVAGSSYTLPVSVTANRTSGAFEIGSAFPSPTITVYESQKPTIARIEVEGAVAGNVNINFNDSVKLRGIPSDASTGGSGICSCEFTVDSSTGTTGNDCVYTMSALTADKSYNVTAASIDGANNKSTAISNSFTVNIKPVEINYQKLTRAYYDSANPTLNTGDIEFQTASNGTFSSACDVNIKDSSGSSVSTTTINKSGTNPVKCSGIISVGSLTDGQYMLEVTVTDEDNDSVTSQKVFYVCDNTSSPGCERADLDNDNVPETTSTNLYSSIHGSAISCDSCPGKLNTGQDHDADGIDNVCDADYKGSICGNGKVETGEECDDGNVLDDDGCSSVCKNEGGGVCGNGVLETGEGCDDGNTVSGDGCSGSCAVEVAALCGNGTMEAGEQCDDGNTAGGDGCSATCLLEVAPGCGNGVVELGEGCDDGNTANGDGCSSDCRVETATPTCGNAVLEVGEDCDDGNTADGDGCSATCTLEGVIVPGAPVCGNGILEEGEECDDGNNADDDGCDAYCDFEREKEKEKKALPLTLEDIIAPFKPLADALSNLMDAIAQTALGRQISKVYDSKAVQYTQKQIIPPAIYTATILNLLSFQFLPDLLQYFMYFFTEPFVFIFRRKRKKWGMVYNSMTKMPIAYTIVRAYDKATNKLIKTTVSDKDGRYLFILDPGSYYITINKKEYEFPSKYLKEKETDYKYLDIYHGATINVTEENANVTVNIPIDPNIKMRPNSTILAIYALKKLQSFISFVGPTLAIIAFVVAPTWKYFAFLAVHAVLFSFFKALALRAKPKSFGIVQDKKTGGPLSRSIVRVFETKYNKLLDTQVADGKGRYAFLVGQNTYKVNTQKQGYKPATTSPIDLTKKEKEAIIDVDLKMEKA